MTVPTAVLKAAVAAKWWPFTWTWWSWNIPADLHEMLQFEWVRNAFEAGTMVAIVAGVVGYLIVLRRSSFASHALGHVGFSGAAGAVVYSVAPLWGLLLATTGSAGGIAVLGKKAANRDVEIGTILAFMLALGMMFIQFYNGYATEAYSILFGDIVGIDTQQVVVTFWTCLGVLLILAVFFRRLVFASLDEEVAEAKGMATLGLGLIFMLTLGIVIAFAVTVVGVLLIFALSVTPAAIAVRLVKRPWQAVLVSVSVALFATWAGIFIGFWEYEPTSFFIVAIIFVLYVAVRLAVWLAGLLRPSASSVTRPSPPRLQFQAHPPVPGPVSAVPRGPVASPSDRDAS